MNKPEAVLIEFVLAIPNSLLATYFSSEIFFKITLENIIVIDW